MSSWFSSCLRKLHWLCIGKSQLFLRKIALNVFLGFSNWWFWLCFKLTLVSSLFRSLDFSLLGYCSGYQCNQGKYHQCYPRCKWRLHSSPGRPPPSTKWPWQGPPSWPGFPMSLPHLYLHSHDTWTYYKILLCSLTIWPPKFSISGNDLLSHICKRLTPLNFLPTDKQVGTLELSYWSKSFSLAFKGYYNVCTKKKYSLRKALQQQKKI